MANRKENQFSTVATAVATMLNRYAFGEENLAFVSRTATVVVAKAPITFDDTVAGNSGVKVGFEGGANRPTSTR